MKIYMTRHGETKWNQEGRMQGWKNSDLTQEGIEKAKKLGQSLTEVDFKYVYCSPLGRAVETAKHIIGDKEAEIILCDQVKEMGFGRWEGMKNSEVEALYGKQKFNFWNNPKAYESVEGESFEELIERARSVVEELSQLKHVENILIVSHAIWIKAIYAVVKGYSLEEFWNPPFIMDTSLTILEVKDGKIKIEVEADTSHL